MKKNKNEMVDEFLLSIQEVPKNIVQAEKVTEKLLNKKLSRKQKASVKYKSAISNYKKAVRRYKLANTLLEKHFKILQRIVSKYGAEDIQEPQNETE